MWFDRDIKTISPTLLAELRLCAHLIVLDLRCANGDHVDEGNTRREACALLRSCLETLCHDPWSQETGMACYQRAIDEALALDLASLHQACGVFPERN